MKKHRLFIAFLYLSAFLVVFMICNIINQGVTMTVWRAGISNRSVFIIDAGHGGIDGGATSCTGVLESHINLQIALKLNDLLHLLGHETLMIRSTDTSVYTEGKTIAAQKVSDLKNRVRTVNETDNAILVSIHQNTFSDQRYSGAQVFYSRHEDGMNLANVMQAELQAALYPGNDRKSKRSQGIYLMDNITKPGILIECGFISNPSDASRLTDHEYQKKLCCVIGCTLNRY